MKFTALQQSDIDVLIKRRLLRERESFERVMQAQRDRHVAELAILQAEIARLKSERDTAQLGEQMVQSTGGAMSLEATGRIERLNSEEMLDLRSQFIDFGLNLSHASQLNPELFVDVIEMALDFRHDLDAPTSGRLAHAARGS